MIEPLPYGLAELLRLTGAPTLAELSDQVDDHADLDAWLPPLKDQEALPAGLLVRVADMGTVLRFPFTPSALFAIVDELQADVEERWHELESWE